MKKIFEVFLLITFFTIGCLSIGGQSSNPEADPVAKLKTAMDTVQKDIDDSKKQLENITGDVTMNETRMKNIQNEQTNILQQITEISTTNNQYNESISSLMWTIAWIWIAIKIIAFIQYVISAKYLPGSTFKNFFTLPWNKGKE